MANKIPYRIIIILSSISLLFLIVLALNGLFSNGKAFGMILFFGLLLFLSIAFFLIYKLSDESKLGMQFFWIALIGLGIIIRLVYSCFIDVEVESDQIVCLNAAWNTVKGDYSWVGQAYFANYAYQIPFVLYEAFLLSIFHSVRALYIFNAVFSVLTLCMIFVIANQIVDKTAALITTAIYACFPASIFMIGLLYNQIQAGFFMLLAIFFVVKVYRRGYARMMKKLFTVDLLFCAAAGVFFGISNLFRVEGIIGILAVEVFLVFLLISNTRKGEIGKHLIKTLLCMAVTFTGYWLINNAVDYMVIQSGINQYGIKNGCVYWTIVCGLTPDSYGSYNTKYAYIQDIRDKNEQYDAFKKILGDIFGSMSLWEVFVFFMKKQYYMWGNPDNCLILNTGFTVPDMLSKVIVVLNHYVYITIMILSGIGLWKKNHKSVFGFFEIAFLGYFCVYVIKEIKPVYRYSMILVIVLMAASGIDYLVKNKQSYSERIHRLCRKRKKQKAV